MAVFQINELFLVEERCFVKGTASAVPRVLHLKFGFSRCGTTLEPSESRFRSRSLEPGFDIVEREMEKTDHAAEFTINVPQGLKLAFVLRHVRHG